MNIIEAAQMLKTGKTVEQIRFKIIPSVAGFLDFKYYNEPAIQSNLNVDDLLSSEWSVVDA